ncbi:MAG TPA: glycosyltransferase family 2 protein [Staphylococcus kloosii]|uniref:Glycosyltransferase family 2 protein n=1 Tax=Staphylococcus kloosii TaxID=29384 RepID=A0A921H186_9STAP|nr:glycosyltransferase family 2 protein [Staphylococcus kloosii]HJF68803.1 glycosyltransferase family 2 protein [Staphylococcus kloosii]
MEKLVSIIIPVYNKENYLKTCIDSLINMKIDHAKMEAIFVDDCSTDKSVEIINKYVQAHDFIKLIQLEHNTGSPSTPRNVGIKEAEGKYLTLLDADDWLDAEGFPEFIDKVNADDADFGLGQSYKHTNKNITYHARFTSYKDASNLKPEEIEKIFRAVGPPGKVFKRKLVIENQIEFEHMKFGEDKLFFTELMSKVSNITMSTVPVYHVNRYVENVSLVKETSVLDKAYINKDIVQKICDMDIPTYLMKMALSRMVEVDFFRRFFHTKTFLKSDDKKEFYAIFDQVEKTITDRGFDIKEFLNNKIFAVMYELYHQADKAEFIKFTTDVVFGNWRFYVERNTVYKTLENSSEHLKPLAIGCYPIYEGTQFIDGKKFEVVKLLKDGDITITGVSLDEINNALNTQYIDFAVNDDKIFIQQDEFNKTNSANVNICVHYGEMDRALVFTSYPSDNTYFNMKRQTFKLELKKRTTVNNLKQYFITKCEPLITLQEKNLYDDLELSEQVSTIEAGTKVMPTDIKYSLSGTPRLILENDVIMSANKDGVAPLDMKNHAKYIIKVPNKVEILKKCKLYNSRAFDNEPIQTLKPNEDVKIKNIIYTNNSTPRLVTEEGFYLTANKDFVKVIQ